MAIWAGYSRVSRVGDRADTLISPDQQAQRIREYAAGRGLEVEMLPAELDVSGGKLERPILNEAIRGIEDGRYAGLIVAQLDRLSRLSLLDALQVIHRVEKGAGGRVIAVAENFDAATPEGRMARNVMLSLGDMQLSRYKQQFRAAKEQAVKRGIWPTPVVPMGYRRGADRRLEPDPQTRDKVVAAFEARAQGKPWREVAAILGVGLSAAAKVIRNRAYLGELQVGKGVDRFHNAAAHEPLVSRAVFEAAQVEHARPPRGVHPGALLAGLTVCAGCGCKMTPNASRRGNLIERIYRCSAGNKAAGRCGAPTIIAQGKLDAYVVQLVLAETLAFSASERSHELDAAQQALEVADAELVSYQTMTMVSGIAAEHFVAGMRSRIDAVDEARRLLAAARLAQGPLPRPGTLRGLWPEMTLDERRLVLRSAVDEVWVRRGRGEAEDRVRVIATGFGRPSRGARERASLEPLAWDDDLPGEVRPSGA